MGRTVRWIAGTAVIVILVAVGAYLRLGPARGGTPSVVAAPTAPRPVPVTIGSAETKEFPIYRVGIGTVQAYNTVTVKVRVDGEVQKIAFREGQDVKPGDLLAVIDPRPLEAQLRQAQADKAHDEALLANAKLDLTRYSALATHDYATRQSVDTQNALVAQYRAAIERDEAVIDNARVQLGYATIVAPLAGRTGLRLIDQGNIVHAADATGLVVITQIKPIAVVFTLPQQHLPEITDALRSGSLEVIAYDQDNRLLLGKGQLELIDNRVEQNTGSVKLKAVFPNDDERLWPGAFVNAWLRLAVRRGPVVPTAAVQAGPEGNYAFVIRPDTSVEVRPVRVAAAWQSEALIEAGLAAGDRIVVDGQYKLRPGAHVVAAPKDGGDKTAEAKPREATP
jgi:membrane fusion protein, multidrug efflux system